MAPAIPAAAAEGSEFEALYDWETAPDAEVRRKLGFASFRVGGGGALSVRDDSTHFWTKALGFGFAEPVTRDLIGQVVAFYEEQEAPLATIQIASSVIPADWDQIRAETNLSEGGKWVKLACETEAALDAADRGLGGLGDGLRVGPVAPAHAATWSATMAGVFGMPDESVLAMAAASVERPGWHPFAVWAGDQIIATATMHVHRDVAQFVGGATVPDRRRQGAQTALIAARARAARDAGCRWLVVETGAEAPGTHNSSLHNLRRAGFEVLYERTNWIWRPGQAK